MPAELTLGFGCDFEFFGGAERLNPEKLTIFGTRHDQGAPKIAWDSGVYEKVLQLGGAWGAQRLKAIAGMPVAECGA